MHKYKCRHCGTVVSRDTKRAWIKSYCIHKQRYAHLTLLDEHGAIIDWHRNPDKRADNKGVLSVEPH